MLSDVDEIPRPHAVRALRKCDFAAAGHNCAALEGVFFYYSYSQKAGEWKAAPKVEPGTLFLEAATCSGTLVLHLHLCTCISAHSFLLVNMSFGRLLLSMWCFKCLLLRVCEERGASAS